MSTQRNWASREDIQTMKPPSGNGFAERREAAAKAKAQLLNKFAAAPKPDDPEMLQKRAEREAIAAARTARLAERTLLKKQEAAHNKAEAALKAETEAKMAAETAEAARARETAEAVERKAERDRRYAARKARQK